MDKQSASSSSSSLSSSSASTPAPALLSIYLQHVSSKKLPNANNYSYFNPIMQLIIYKNNEEQL